MITRLSGTLERIEDHAATLRVGSGEVALEVLLPGYVARDLAASTGESVTLHTLCYLEGQGQGTSFEPRLIGFRSPADRRFFDLFTTVKGIGNRKALRALAEPPATVAAWIARRDAKALTALPEIGKRLAETIVAELFGKVEPFLAGPIGDARPTSALEALPASGRGSLLPPPVQDAVDALCALGESRPDAERKVQRALEKSGAVGGGGGVAGSGVAASADAILALVYAGR